MRYIARFLVRLVSIASFGALVFLSPVAGVAANAQQDDATQKAPVANWQQLDVDGDGDPDVSRWSTSWRDAAFSLTVVDGGSDMQWSANWQDATDFFNDIWLFDHNSDSAFELAIRFSEGDDGHSQASLWDDQDDNGQVELTIDGANVLITESEYPTLVVSTAREWPEPSGRLSGSLSFLYDGTTEARLRRGYSTDLVPIDGHPDFETRVVDGNDDGVADFVHTRVLALIPEQNGVQRDHLYVNVGAEYPAFTSGCLYWSLLNYDPEYRQHNYFSSPAFVNVNWEGAKVESGGITGYPIEVGYHVNNANQWQEGKVNQASFENAMSYYDLAGNQDGLPELHVRLVHWPHKDSLFPRNASFDVNWVRYSWRIIDSERLNWNYKIGLLGSNPITSTVAYDKFSLYAVPYWELPNWVVQHDWYIATFVTIEDRPYVSSEGVYEWSTGEGVINSIFASADSPERYVPGSTTNQRLCYGGFGDCELGENYFDIAAGLSGEYGQIDGQPLLYLSPIDNRLHLKSAEHGVWRLDEEEIVRVGNLDGDEFIDVWSREVDPVATDDDHTTEAQDNAEVSLPDDTTAKAEIMETIFAVCGHLLYGGDGRITLLETDYQPSLFEILPPTDHDTWEAHRSQVSPFEAQRRNPRDLASWLDVFPGPRGEISGATLGNVRITDHGFRFELSLHPGYQAAGTLGPDLEGLAPGDYVVTYRDTFSVQPFTPALVEALSGSLELQPATPLALQPMDIGLQVHNYGLGDLPQLAVQLYAGLPGTDPQLVAQEVVGILAGQTLPLVFRWTPPMAGDWLLSFVWAEDPEAVLAAGYARAALDLRVGARPPLAAGQIWRLSNVEHPLPLLWLLGALGLLAAALGIVLLRPGGGRR